MKRISPLLILDQFERITHSASMENLTLAVSKVAKEVNVKLHLTDITMGSMNMF